MTMTLTGAQVVTPGGVITGGWLRIDGGRIAAVGDMAAPASEADERVALGNRWVVPGFVDLHVHGGGGHSMLADDPDEIRSAAAFHLGHGTTRSLASIVSAPLDEMLAALRAVRDVVGAAAGAGPIIGSHLEGPFLSPARAGAHDPRCLLAPEPATFDRLHDAAGGTLRAITVAPELPGGLELVRHAVAAGVIVALGHSDADEEQAAAAFDAGASLVTHLFNGMRPWHHRQPGLAGAALARAGVVCELIDDGIHLHDATARIAYAAAGPDRIALVTDAIAATGAGEGDFRLGHAAVHVRDGAPRLAGTETLAGSTLTMDVALRRAVRDLRVPMTAAVESASTTPARLLGIGPEAGAIAPGLAADLVVLSDDLEVEAVMVAGRWTASGRLFNR